MENSQKVFQHLDKLRMDYHLTVGQFCDGITTDRQYRRYLSGDSFVSPKNLEQFCQKLRLTIDEFYFSFYNNDKREYQKVVQIYKLLGKRNVQEAKELMDQLPHKQYLTEETQQFLEYCEIMYGFYTKQYTQAHTIDLLRNIIDYPHCTNKNTISLIEIITIRTIVWQQALLGIFDDADVLYAMIENPKRQFVNENTRSFMPNIYETLSKTYGIKEDYKLAIQLAEKGIKASIEGNYVSALLVLYYTLSTCQYRIGNRQSAYESAKKAVATAIALDDQSNLDKLNKMLQKEQGYSFDITKI
jgi:tetratricopeptide (TPR) repeat protein